MARRIARAELREFARAGAEARLIALRAEAAALVKMFPDLARPGRSSSSAAGRSAATGKKRGRRTPMSAAERKAVSLRMKKYWAKRRAAKKRG